MKLNKKEFIKKIAEANEGVTSAQVQKILSTFQVVLLEILKEEKEAQLLDIGKLKVSHRNERTGVNPKTKQAITLPAKDVPRLAASKKLKGYVAGTEDVSLASFNY